MADSSDSGDRRLTEENAASAAPGCEARYPRPLSAGMLAAFLFPLAALLAWSDSFSSPLLLDDSWNLVNNPGLTRIWPPWWPFLGSINTGLAGRPVTAFTFALNNVLWGGSVFGYHLVNLSIHVLSGLALFGLLRSMFRFSWEAGNGKTLPSLGEADWLAFFCALIWLVHPLTIQSVTYITQRLESLAGLFYLLTMLGAAKSIEPGVFGLRRAGWNILSVLSFILGVGSKEIIVTAPFAVFLYEWAVTRDGALKILARSAWRYLGYALGLALLFALVSTGQTANHAYAGGGMVTGYDYALFQPRVIWHYIRLAMLPYGLCFDYGRHMLPRAKNIFDASLGVKLAWAAALCIPVAGALRLLLKRRLTGLAVSLFFLILIPTSSFLPLFRVAEEQRMYLPLAALMALAVTGGYGLLRRSGSSGKKCAVVGSLLVMALALLTFERNLDFRSEKGLWLATIERVPNNPDSYNMLGLISENDGNLRMAQSYFERALRAAPDLASAENNLGLVMWRQGRTTEAITHYNHYIKELARIADAYDMARALSNLGMIYIVAGNLKEAKAVLYKAVAMDPNYSTALSRLGAVLVAAGEPQPALALLRKAVYEDQKSIDARLNLAKALKSLGRVPEAARYLREAKELDPNDVQVKRVEKEFSGETPEGKSEPVKSLTDKP